MNPNQNLSSSIPTPPTNNDKMSLPISSGFYRSRIYTSDISINPLIVACDPILTLMATLKTIEYPSDRNKFLDDLVHEIRAFEQRARMANYSENIITDARYVLCCLLDETVALTSEWGKNDGWLQNNLLSIFHNENYGGEYFFTIINRVLENITTSLHLLELLYLCLSFGFMGKYRHIENGKNELISITDNLYQTICQYRRHNHHSLFISNSKSKLASSNNDAIIPSSTINIKRPGMIVTLSFILCSIVYFSIYLKLHDISKPLYPLIEYNNFKNGS